VGETPKAAELLYYMFDACAQIYNQTPLRPVGTIKFFFFSLYFILYIPYTVCAATVAAEASLKLTHFDPSIERKKIDAAATAPSAPLLAGARRSEVRSRAVKSGTLKGGTYTAAAAALLL